MKLVNLYSLMLSAGHTPDNYVLVMARNNVLDVDVWRLVRVGEKLQSSDNDSYNIEGLCTWKANAFPEATVQPAWRPFRRML